MTDKLGARDDYDDDLEHGYCGNIGCEDGWVADCFDGFCVNAEDGCELCLRRCDWCNPRPSADAPPSVPSLQTPQGGDS